MNKDSTRRYSKQQEDKLAKQLGGNCSSNSGGTRFGGGDVLTDYFLVEAKTPMSEKKSFSIQSSWIEKAKEQAYEQNKMYWTLAFRFGPDKCHQDYFIIDSNLFKLLNRYLENEMREINDGT